MAPSDYAAVDMRTTRSPSLMVGRPGREMQVVDNVGACIPVAPQDAAEANVMKWSLVANVVLSVAKCLIAFQSGSLAVLASVIDSALDLLSQIVLAAASSARNVAAVEYPAGRARLEPVAVVVCAMLMGVSAMGVMMAAVNQLIALAHGKDLEVVMDAPNALIMALAVVWKAWLYVWITRRHAELTAKSAGVEAVALDHFNDVLSNGFALVAALLAARYGMDYADPIGAIGISLYITYSWTETAVEQIQHLVGKSADPGFLATLRETAADYSDQMTCDIVRAYHFGPRYLVELEMVMDQHTPLKVSHDLALDLQQKVESIEEVERCFVHVDYDFRGYDEHVPENYSPLTPGNKKALA